jgi:hypothetical protein
MWNSIQSWLFPFSPANARRYHEQSVCFTSDAPCQQKILQNPPDARRQALRPGGVGGVQEPHEEDVTFPLLLLAQARQYVRPQQDKMSRI